MMKPDKDKPKAPAKKTDSKVFDVRRPGKALASPTSKPVIMGHKPAVQQNQAAVSGIGETRPLMTRRKIQIMPTGDIEVTPAEPVLSEVATPSVTPTDTVVVKTETPEVPAKPTLEETEALATAALDAVTGPPDMPEPTPETPVKTPEVSPEQQAPRPAPEVETETPAEQPVQPSAVETATESKTEQPTPKVEPSLSEKELPVESSSMPEVEPVEKIEEKEEETAPPEPIIEPLFDDSGSIIVSNHEHEHRHHGLKVVGLLVVIILLAVAALNIALDLGLLSLEGVPHTDFL